jgi:Holliday junction resolvase RusA-like endonuclease
VDIQQLFPRASKDTINLNRGASGPERQQAVRDRPHGKVKGEKKDPVGYSVRVTSYRSRLCDPDNLLPKYFIDALRYAGVLPDDRPEDIKEYSISQKKVSKTEEKTLIEITVL